jgi:transporter family protein
MEEVWLIFALLSAIGAAFVAIFAKIGLQNIDANTSTMIRAVVMALFLIGVVLVEGKLSNVSPILSNHKALMYIVLSGIAGALSWLFYFVALQTGPASKVFSIDKLSLLFVLIFSVLILGEKFDIKVGIGAALMALGAILVSLK